MKHYSLAHETEAHYVLHDSRDGKLFHIAKKGIDKNTSDTIKSLPAKKEWAGYDNDMPQKGNIPGTDATPADEQPQAYSKGTRAVKEDNEEESTDSDTSSEEQTLSPYEQLLNNLQEKSDGGYVAEKPEQQNTPARKDWRQLMGGKSDEERAKEHTSDGGPQRVEVYGGGNNPAYAEGGQVQQYDAGTDYVTAPQTTPADIGSAAATSAIDALAPNTMPNPNIPPNFEAKVREQAINLSQPPGASGRAMVPNFLHPPSEFKEQAETDVARNYMQSQHDAQQQAAQNYQSTVDKINSDNQVRAKAGLEPLAVPPPPSAPGQPIQPPGTKIPLDQQVSMQTPSSQPGLGLPMTDLTGQYQQAIGQETAGIKGAAEAQAAGAAASAKAMQDYVNQQKQQQVMYEQENADTQRHLSDLEQGVAQGRINPNRMWQNMDTAGKISASIGLVFGGIGAGLTHSPNQALEVIQNAINRDIQAQMADKSDKMTLYKVGLEKYRDQRAAQQFAVLQANALLQGQLGQIAQKTQSQAVKSAAEQAMGALKVQSIPVQQQLAIQAAQMRLFNEPSPQAGINTNKIRAGVALGVIPKESAEPMIKEVGDYNQLRGILDDVDNTFDILNKNKNYTQRMLPHWTPTIRDTSKAYEAEGNRFLGQITKETEGRVTPADVDLMKSSLPIQGDSPELVQQKINKIKDQIKAKYKFGNLGTYNLLSPNDPIVTPSSTREKRFTPGKPSIR